MPRLNRILALKDLGFSLEQIAKLLDESLSPAKIRGMLRLKQAELQQLVEEEQTRLSRVEARLKQIEQEESMPNL
nr:MerR family DNA-binding protein [Chroococcidiopsis sp. CCMEE 29]